MVSELLPSVKGKWNRMEMLLVKEITEDYNIPISYCRECFDQLSCLFLFAFAMVTFPKKYFTGHNEIVHNHLSTFDLMPK